jgi:hypothetical protein
VKAAHLGELAGLALLSLSAGGVIVAKSGHCADCKIVSVKTQTTHVHHYIRAPDAGEQLRGEASTGSGLIYGP